MRKATKLLPVLLLGSVLTGCSMAGTGDYFADEYADLQRQQMPGHYGAPADCAPSPCQSYMTGNSSYASQAVSPDLHAYGRSVQNHPAYGAPNYVPSHYGAGAHGLRGAPFKPHTYGSLGIVNYEAGDDLYGAQARFGYQFSKYFGAELEGSQGLSKQKDDLIVGGVPLEQTIGIENSIAAFGVARYPLVQKLSGYGRLGYHNTELDEKVSDGVANPVNREFSVNGIAYGGGLQYDISPRTAVRLDYTVYDYDGPDADAVSLAVSRKF